MGRQLPSYPDGDSLGPLTSEHTATASGPTSTEPRDQPPRDSALLERGATVGRYVVLDRIGAGGMGEVYSAYDPELDRKVALKVHRDDPDAEGEEQRARLMREAQALARLSHPNVVAVYDVGSLPSGDLFFTEELVVGTTLRDWLRAGKRSWRDVLRVYLAAGRGLAAAHRADLVHRDFKPGNVLLGSDGVVKVTDFGLARAVPSGEAPDPKAAEGTAPPRRTPAGLRLDADKTEKGAVDPLPSDSGSLNSDLTRSGTVLGTPGYMAPEQYLAMPVDARSDQFSFCAALFEGLYGVRPFAGNGAVEIFESITAGQVVEVRDRRGVPQWVHRVLLRGLSEEPSARFPSLDDLLKALSRNPDARWWRAATALAAVAAILGAALVGRHWRGQPSTVCTGGPAAMAEAWNRPARDRIERAFAATGVDFATDVFRRTRDALDGYASRWTTAYGQACEATRLRGEQSESVMGLRMTCLEQRRAQVRALADVLGKADRETVEKAVDAVATLPSVADCADTSSLTSVEPLPSDAERRASIDGVRRELAPALALSEAGKFKEALELAAPLRERARSIGYGPLVAEVSLAVGDAMSWSGASADAAPVLEEAALAAEAGRADEVKAQALVALINVYANIGRFDEAHHTADLADAASRRLTDPSKHRIEIMGSQAWILLREGKFDEGKEAYERLIPVAERTVDVNPTTLAEIYLTAAVAESQANEVESALGLLDRADSVIVGARGPDHRVRVTVQLNRSFVLLNQLRWSETLAAADAGLEIAMRMLLPESDDVSYLHENRAEALMGLGRFEEGLTEARLAEDIGKKAFGPSSAPAIVLGQDEGDALLGLGRAKEAAALFAEILARLAPLLPSDDMSLAYAHLGLGEARTDLHDARGAAPELETAVAMFEKKAPVTPFDRDRAARARALLARARR
jgi:eukaryotic-like serine/threonine-protein kinase